MGLDMYLEAEFQLHRHGSAGTRVDDVLAAIGLDPVVFRTRFDEVDYVDVSVEVGYWRKATAIHRWFVANVQHGSDDCARYEVSTEQLKSLQDLCNEVLASVQVGGHVGNLGGRMWDSTAGVLHVPLAYRLPSQHGDYDEWYVEELKSTVKQIEAVLTEPTLKNTKIYYRASW